MKYFVSQLVFMVRKKGSKRNLALLMRFFAVLIAMIVLYSTIFHFIMEWEGKHYSWITGFYWTLTVMSTLGFGDITFESDLGKLFSIFVLMSGIMFLLVLLPFTFIQFFYAPWIEAQAAAQTPRYVASDSVGHVILVNHDSVSEAFIQKLSQFQRQYVVIVPDLDEAISMVDRGMQVLVGEIDDPETYLRSRAEHAALIVTTHDDQINTNVTFTARQVAPHVPIAASCNRATSVDILQRAGATHVMQLGENMGRALARCTVGGDAKTHIVGRFDRLLIAEANAARSPLVGRTLIEAQLYDLGIHVVGIWDKGVFSYAKPESVIGERSILVIAGSAQHLASYDERFVIYNVSTAPVVIIGGGRVGRSAARALANRGIKSRVIEQVPGRVPDDIDTIMGDASDFDVLSKAGLMKAPAVLITTHDDNLNIYLTIYCRSLREDIQIISRSTLERNSETLHRAGADFVYSYASMGATTLFNMIAGRNIVTIDESFEVFRTMTPASLEGKTIESSGVREKTGCSIVAIQNENELLVSPTADSLLSAGQEIILIGDSESETLFFEKYK